MEASTASAIGAVRELGRELGFAAEPVLVAERSNLVLRLDLTDGPVIARVALATSSARVGMQWLRREVEVSRYLSARGAPVTEPALRVDAGPHERRGFVISFWRHEREIAEPPSPAAVGATLATVHRALASYPEDALPVWGGFREAREVMARARATACFDSDERSRIERAWERAERIVESVAGRTASFQAVHGDAHVRNVLTTERGTLWTDWEDAFVGPVEWDIASLRSRAELFGEDRELIDAACAAYPLAYDRELCRELGLVRNLQVIPWLAVFAERDPGLLPRMRARIARLP